MKSRSTSCKSRGLKKFYKSVAALSAACLIAAGSSAAEEDDAKLFADYLKYSREVAAKHHLIVRAHFDRESSKAKDIDFKYDRYPEVEQILLPSPSNASYVRKKGKDWIKSDDWGETGKPAPKSATKDFDNWIGLIDAPLQDIRESRDKTQGAVKPTLMENEEDAKPDEIRFMMMREHPTGFNYPRFAFTTFKDHALIKFFGGTMRYGEEQLVASIGYEYMFLVNVNMVTPTPSPANPTGSVPAPNQSETSVDDAGKLLAGAMKKMERGSWEVDEIMVGQKTTHVHGLINGKDFDLTSEVEKTAPHREIMIVTLGWTSDNGGKTWQKTKADDRSMYDWVHTAIMNNPSMPPFETVGTEQHDGETWKHVRMKVDDKNAPDDSLWHYWIALDAKAEAVAVRKFQGAGIIRGEVMSTKGTYRPSKEIFIKPPRF